MPNAPKKRATHQRDSVRDVRQTTIRLTDELDAAITREANAAGISKGELMRQGIAHWLGYLAATRGDPAPLPPPPPSDDD